MIEYSKSTAKIPVREHEKANDQHVRAVYVYASSSDTKAYVDSDCTAQITTAELKRLFLNGMIIVVDGGVNYAPVSYSEDAGVGEITYVKTGASSLEAATLTGKA